MSDAVIVALITVTANIIIQVFSAAGQSKQLLEKLKSEQQLADAKLDAKLEKHQAVTDQKIEELTREVREHNNFAKRVPILEEKVKNIESRE